MGPIDPVWDGVICEVCNLYACGYVQCSLFLIGGSKAVVETHFL